MENCALISDNKLLKDKVNSLQVESLKEKVNELGKIGDDVEENSSTIDNETFKELLNEFEEIVDKVEGNSSTIGNEDLIEEVDVVEPPSIDGRVRNLLEKSILCYYFALFELCLAICCD
ncbi:hypothetical protein RND71_039504 [Anisodus tanguticus]|uniref:Uncharacterized protein n=1 Tax=Anisodus tanguticus TaxID=243964 RepID=A0AAE1UQQ0_9SOLA|nr:hypothetical protein RND71_039504 [Anisodus tanguticus]